MTAPPTGAADDPAVAATLRPTAVRPAIMILRITNLLPALSSNPPRAFDDGPLALFSLGFVTAFTEIYPSSNI